MDTQDSEAIHGATMEGEEDDSSGPSGPLREKSRHSQLAAGPGLSAHWCGLSITVNDLDLGWREGVGSVRLKLVEWAAHIWESPHQCPCQSEVILHK